MTDPRAVAGLRVVLGRTGARAGWKIGLNVPAVQHSLGLSGSVAGVLPEATRLVPGEPCSLAGALAPHAEPEVAIRVGEAGAVAALAPAIEVVDVDLPFEDLEAIVAGNVFHRAFVLGEAVPARPLDGLVARVTLDGGSCEVALPPGIEASAGVVRAYAEAAGAALEPGDWIICGSLTRPLTVEPGQAMALEIGPLGGVRLELAG